MLKSVSFIKNRLEQHPVLFGILLVVLGFIPFILLKEGSVVITHDQLDGELLAYIFHGNYLGTGVNVFPQWMGGVDKTALTPPAMLPLLFYKYAKPLTAFLGNQFLISLTAFIGMFYFLQKLWKNMAESQVLQSPYKNSLLLVVALCFSYLPFYSMYGLCVAGIPLLVYVIWELTEGKNIVWNLLGVLYFGVMSSFVLIGYAVVSILCLYCIFLFRKRKKAIWVYGATFGLILYYMVTNLDLVLQVLGKGGGEVSHKTELVLSPLPFWKTTINLFLEGTGHAASFHKWMILPVIILLFYKGIRFSKSNRVQKNQYILLCSLFGSTVFIALFYGVYHWAPIVTLRSQIGGPALFFQIDRIYWLYPFLWYTILMMVILMQLSDIIQTKSRLTARIGILGACLFLALVTSLWNSDFKKNIRQMINPTTSNAITWDKYFGGPVFTQIKDYIGKEQSSYRVGSIGLHPSVAAYHGFHTIDGYSNNYNLSYKLDFRKIIAGELEKSPELKTYFDDWGNRCYLFSSQLGKNYYFPKDSGIVLTDLDLNMEQLRKMGCEYLFSTVEIGNAQELGLHWEKRFETEKVGFYAIYLYSVRN